MIRKKFSVNVHYDVVISTEVFAESEEEAMDLAIGKTDMMSLNEGECVGTNACVTEVSVDEEEMTPQKESLIDRIKAILLGERTNLWEINIVKDDITFSRMKVTYDVEETRVENITIFYSFDNCTHISLIQDMPMEVLTEILKKIQGIVNDSK